MVHALTKAATRATDAPFTKRFMGLLFLFLRLGVCRGRGGPTLVVAAMSVAVVVLFSLLRTCLLWSWTAPFRLLVALALLLLALWSTILGCRAIALITLGFAVRLTFRPFRLIKSTKVGISQKVDRLVNVLFVVFLYK